ncbi:MULTISPECIES: Uma2 family endonuclease [unclassified Streptomyces]|uniref:Uma2 family endonuclease n=1 Tax=unclassified Streptomyces TaxID=2593676 RepID=UPI0012504322|nr:MULTISPECIES: Uma2 family endonuclease [unclassified Streptomyces]KAB2973220.1 Uma2 family endonuclease [Streptomyces sp. SS1-1]MDI9836133.1 Uma2 family endonuclease [Streptomyces sp. KAU_LT]
MTAEPVKHRVRWPVPPQDGYTVDDLFTLPDLPPHTELIDGSLVFVSPQRDFHSVVIDLLVNGLRQTAPPGFRTRREMTVVLDQRNGPEPDVSIVRTEAITGSGQTHYAAKDVLLAVEVVSPDSESRDRTTKPQKYATAGIPSFWRVEENGASGKPVIHVYELDPMTQSYVHMGMHRDRIKVDKPYSIDIDLTAIDEL